MDPQEVTWRPVSVDLEWGKLSGKIGVTGSKHSTSSFRVLGVHGWLDNANTFDTLAPFLPRGTELLALDLPGHGHSDHLPTGAQYDILSYVLHLKRGVDKCGWDKFILVGHSMGACIGNIFTALFPDHVTALVSLDYVSVRIPSSIGVIQQNISGLFKGEELRKQKPVVYSEEQAIERLIKARANMGNNEAIDRDAAYVLLPRSARQVEGGYVWSHDPRARSNFQSVIGNSWITYISHITCPVLIVAANQGICTSAVLTAFEETLSVYRSSAKWFDVAAVDGSHHVHLTHPQRVAKPLLAFLHRVAEETAPAPPLQARL